MLERLPVGMIQGPVTSVMLVMAVTKEPGAKTPDSRRRRVRMENKTRIGLKKSA